MIAASRRERFAASRRTAGRHNLQQGARPPFTLPGPPQGAHFVALDAHFRGKETSQRAYVGVGSNQRIGFRRTIAPVLLVVPVQLPTAKKPGSCCAALILPRDRRGAAEKAGNGGRCPKRHETCYGTSEPGMRRAAVAVRRVSIIFSCRLPRCLMAENQDAGAGVDAGQIEGAARRLPPISWRACVARGPRPLGRTRVHLVLVPGREKALFPVCFGGNPKTWAYSLWTPRKLCIQSGVIGHNQHVPPEGCGRSVAMAFQR